MKDEGEMLRCGTVNWGTRKLASCLLLLVFAACHPEGCYGPKAFDYNTGGVRAADLVGRYSVDDSSQKILKEKGIADVSGYLELRADMTFAFVNLPCAWNFPEPTGRATASGRWKPVKKESVWEVDFDNYRPEEMCGYLSLSFRVLRDSAPHALELMINHDEGFYIRVERTRDESLR